MNKIAISADDGVPLPAWIPSLKKYALKVLARLGRDKWDLSILLCDDKTISDLNSRYRGKPEPTDVLSFTLGEGEPFPVGGRYSPGDIVISLDTLRENAVRFNISEDEELRRLLIHGILHLDGMNHLTNEQDEPMLQIQERLLTELAADRILGRSV